MGAMTLADILINARKESYRMQHYFIGVEHLFIGMLDVPGSIAAHLLSARGLTSTYVIDLIRRHTGKGASQHMWAGMPRTPRADIVIGVANDLRLEANTSEIGERELLLALLEEDDSIPIRILTRLGIDLAALRTEISLFETSRAEAPALVSIEIAPQIAADAGLTEAHFRLLRQMFRRHDRARIDRRLRGGYTGALLLLVTPIQADGHEDAAVVVKIDQAERIVEEGRRYEAQVRNTLPPLTARLEEQPTTLDNAALAGLKYTFIVGDEASADLRAASANGFDPEAMAIWLRKSLYPTFGRGWWVQRRAFRFAIWTEYDWVLPPLLILERDEPAVAPGSAGERDIVLVINEPVRRQRIAELQYGDRVVVENFTVTRVYRDRDAIQLALGRGSDSARRACKIEVRGVNLADDAFYNSEQVERITGRVYETRAGLLLNALRSLDPPFNPLAQTMQGVGDIHPLPNPLFGCDALLERQITGSYSRIHGDLNLGNILLGPASTPFLIDFAEAREGHTLFDWACLEISILADIVLPTQNAETWQAAWHVLGALAELHQARGSHRASGTHASQPDPLLDHALAPVQAVIGIARECLAAHDQWHEYHAALALCALRAMTWETMTLGARRLMVGVAGLSFYLLNARSPAPDDSATADTDMIDIV